LKEAVREFERTLDLDAENLDAHQWLAKAYRGLGQSAVSVVPAVRQTELADLQELAKRFNDAAAPADARQAAAREFAAALEGWVGRPASLAEPKLPFVWENIREARKTFRDNPDPALRAAAAAVLARLHMVAHDVYRPDDNAKDTTTKKYREAHPAANSAAKPVKVYPLQRPGAPGL
jgi:hypothetical protein